MNSIAETTKLTTGNHFNENWICLIEQTELSTKLKYMAHIKDDMLSFVTKHWK